MLVVYANAIKWHALMADLWLCLLRPWLHVACDVLQGRWEICGRRRRGLPARHGGAGK